MTPWHLFKHLNCTLVAYSPFATTLSRRLIRSSPSPSPLSRFFTSPSFLSNHNKVRDQWPTHIHIENIHAARANFSTASSSFSSASLAVQSLAAPATYRSVLIHCPKDTAVSFISFFLSVFFFFLMALSCSFILF